MITENITTLKINKLTKAQYERALAAGKISDTEIYLTPDDGEGVSQVVSTHNTSDSAHNDIRELITGLNTRLNTALNSEDVDLDQMAEVVAYIKNNKSLIEGVTTSKVNVTDIIDNLTSTATNKPLSAAQGKALKDLIDALQTVVDGKASASTVSSHTTDTTKHITADERTNWNAAKTHADSAHNYAGSATSGGSATSAVKLDSSAGSATQPVYFADGKPVATTHKLEASVPSDAKFTDTVYTHPNNHPASMITGLATVATSGSYNDLSNKPTIPTVNNATLTIQKNGTNVATFTANSANNATANITVPTKTSELTNDSGFKTTDNNTTYTLTRNGGTITLTGSDGTSSSINCVEVYTSQVAEPASTLGNDGDLYVVV